MIGLISKERAYAEVILVSMIWKKKLEESRTVFVPQWGSWSDVLRGYLLNFIFGLVLLLGLFESKW
jgi:hypothetical protein